MSSALLPSAPARTRLQKFLAFFGHQGLSKKSIDDSLLKIGARAFTSVPFQYLLYSLAIWRVPEHRQDPVMWALFGGLVFNTVIRFVMFRYGRRILDLKNGQLVFRGLFLFSTLVMSCVWGGVTARSFIHHGLNFDSWILLSGNLGACATFVPAASFEILAALIYQFNATMTPGIACLIYFHGSHESWVMWSAFALYCLLMSLFAVAQRSTQIALLQSYEKLEQQEAALASAHQDLVNTHGVMSTMLESIDQAFLLFNEAGECVTTPSQKSKTMLAIDPNGKHISDIIPSAVIAKENLDAWVEMLFLDRLEFSEVATHGPSRMEVPSTGSTLNLKYHPMRNAAGEMTALVFTATDVSKEIQAEKSAALERERSEMILRILDAKPSFLPFLNELHGLIEGLKAWDGGDLEKFRQHLHTMKGGALIFGANSLAGSIYSTEIAILGHQGEGLKELVRERGQELDRFYTGWREENDELFAQLGVLANQTVEISRRRIEEVQELFADKPDERVVADTLIDHLLSQEFGELLQEFETHVRSTALKLGKSARFVPELKGPPVFVNGADYHETLRVFVHLFNNAVDHGIESVEARMTAGKPATGTIRVEYERIMQNQREWIRMRVQDDGAGINVAKLRQKMREAGKNEAALGDLEVAMQIFESGVSTRDAVTELSGQGVGMGSVRAAIHQIGGQIFVAATGSKGTTIEILLPHYGLHQNLKEAKSA